METIPVQLRQYKMAATVAASFFYNGRKRQEILYEDEQCYVFDEDENRQALIHFVVVPKKHLPRLSTSTYDDEKLLGHLLLVAKNTALSKGLDLTGYHVVVDEDHRNDTFKGLHVFGRALHHMLWPTGPGSRL